MKKINILLQTELKKDATLVVPDNFVIHGFSARNNLHWRDFIEEIAYEKMKDGESWISFVSIQVAGFISRLEDSPLKHSLIFPSMHKMYDYRNTLFWNVWNSYIPNDIKLNTTGKFDTISNLIDKKLDINSNRVFIRPISPWKPFAGFDCSLDEISYEMNSRVQLERLDKSEMIAVYPYQPIDEIEWRVYVINGDVVTYSPYSWNAEANLDISVREDILDVARKAYQYLEDLGDNYVIDVCTINGVPKVLEINGVSTSGWYKNIDTKRLFEAISTQIYGIELNYNSPSL